YFNTPQMERPSHKQAIKFNILAYLLTYVAYMTLTISMSLTPYVANALQLTHSDAQIGMSLSFLTFSISAVLFATLSDIFSAHNILAVSQLLSIAGLFVIAASQNVLWVFIGFFLLGLGTGCYSSISRALISRHAQDVTRMRRAYAVLSCCIIIAPVMSAYLALLLLPISWRAGYIAMALIEILLFAYSRPLLKVDKSLQKLIPKHAITSGFKHALYQKTYVFNVVIVAILFSFYLSVLMNSFRSILLNQFALSPLLFGILFLGASVFYIFGILLYRQLAEHTDKKRYNFGALLLLFLGVLYLTLVSINIINIVLAIYYICLVTGFLVPMTTGAAMTKITKGHGAAAAMITFSVAFFMAMWEFTRAYLPYSSYHFMLFALWVSFVIVAFLRVLLYRLVKNSH
ncbi:MFS transporter, partial [Facilibium subflavum]|uniref:MFS transporter n=1 Tax=Facilibium subflavum TaxID=2219058 RepID=UPI002E276A7C